MNLPAMQLGPVQLTFDRPIFMGILNITPDSFSDGGQVTSVSQAVQRARALVEAGASILDVGGESTRPGSKGVDEQTELSRVVPVIEALVAARLPAAISVDTSKSAVARAALQAGAHMVNDVRALGDPAMASVLAAAQSALVLMHMRGTPGTMQQGEIVYDNVVREVGEFLRHAADKAMAAGVAKERIVLDPGIGFGKTTQHNLMLTGRLHELAQCGYPILYGPSRKRFLGEITGRPVEDRERATAGACAAAAMAGAHMFRVHDVGAVRDAVEVAWAVARGVMTPAVEPSRFA